MKTVQIVDDLESVRFYHQILLHQAGYQTMTASDGLEALALLERSPVDLVMLDLMMPRMSGTEFLARARSLHRYDGLPVLIITSESNKVAALVAGASGPCEILQKPILPAVLLAALHRLLG